MPYADLTAEYGLIGTWILMTILLLSKGDCEVTLDFCGRLLGLDKPYADRVMSAIENVDALPLLYRGFNVTVVASENGVQFGLCSFQCEPAND